MQVLYAKYVEKMNFWTWKSMNINKKTLLFLQV